MVRDTISHYLTFLLIKSHCRVINPSQNPRLSQNYTGRRSNALWRVTLAGGGVLLVEAVLFENRKGPVMGQLFSLNMLVQAVGRERRLSQYTLMLNKAGFNNVQLCRTGKPYDAILALRWARDSGAATGTGSVRGLGEGLTTETQTLTLTFGLNQIIYIYIYRH